MKLFHCDAMVCYEILAVIKENVNQMKVYKGLYKTVLSSKVTWKQESRVAKRDSVSMTTKSITK